MWFIPAGAGNTKRAGLNPSRRAVYPRWRGEHNERKSAHAFWSGLSPLARGTHRYNSGMALARRFIPAGAGNTSPKVSWGRCKTVYPRWRGEHPTCWPPAVTVGGLSPLARGTHFCQTFVCDLSRFIPAGAGNTYTESESPHRDPVYPRWRGEHPRSQLVSEYSEGLSPLARGTRHTRCY